MKPGAWAPSVEHDQHHLRHAPDHHRRSARDGRPHRTPDPDRRGHGQQRPRLYVQGFDRILGHSLPDLQNQWRRLTNDPRAYLDAAIAQTEANLKEALEDVENDEGEIADAEHDLYSFRMFGVLLDHAVENTRRAAAPKPTVEELDAALLALPRVTRVKRHGAILRVLVAPDPAAEPGAEPEQSYHQNMALLHLARIVALIVRHNEDPDRLTVDIEPGTLPDGYELKEDEDCDGESPDAAGEGGCLPTMYWPVYSWELPALDDAGPRRLDKALAIDDAWDDFAKGEAGDL